MIQAAAERRKRRVSARPFSYNISMTATYDSDFDSFGGCDGKSVIELDPPLFGDSRGFFCEVFKSRHGWNELKQINRSKSAEYTVRGCHAQTGRFCQAKFVQALNMKIYDVITDARPDSKTFGITKAYVLDPARQNMLFVPRGFLHAFCVPKGSDGALFEYFCDNVYDKRSETGVNPLSVIPSLAMSFKDDEMFGGLAEMFSDISRLRLSEKDTAAERFSEWASRIADEYATTGKLWYVG